MLGSWKRFWNAEEIRILVLTSMLLQFILIILAPIRKRTAQKLLIIVLWSSYQAADAVAILALSSILKKQNEAAGSFRRGAAGRDLMPLWAPFLLLHLGGPDTITSYSIEDNELWVRHFLKLVVQVSIAFIVMLELVAVPRMRVAATFLFVAGFTKLAERTWALRSASMDQLRDSMAPDPDPGPNYVEFMEEYVWRREAGQSAYVKRKNEQPQPARVDGFIDRSRHVYDSYYLVVAYNFFKKFKPLVVDLMLSFHERDYSQPFFWDRSFGAFRVVEMELSFIYDLLHTKAIFIRCVSGWVWRFGSLMMVSIAFLFFLIFDKQDYANADIIISYVLLGAALFMEVYSLVLITVSDWMIIRLKRHKHSNMLATVICRLMSFVFPNGKRRWSNSMSQYSLLNFSLGDKDTLTRKILRAVKLYKYWTNFLFIHSVDVPGKLKDLLFDELKAKSEKARDTTDLNKLRNCKGEIMLNQEECNHLRWSIGKELDECILLWHVATDLCFHTNIGDHDSNPNFETAGQQVLGHMRRVLNLCSRKDSSNQSDCELSLIMSNYMVYLLIIQPAMMPAGIGKIRFQDTCAEAKVFFEAEEKGLTNAEAREALLNVETDVDPVEVKGDRSKSVLFYACRLAKQLNMLPEGQRWRLVSGVWVEMFSYAAINCKTFYHAKQLSQGGELLTHIWLLMAHMGIGENYRIEAGQASPTLAFE
jgi:Domain of unknown function (DUF4220)/Protein of unknown function, DUF594